MKKSRYTAEQISYALGQAETGTPLAEVIRQIVPNRSQEMPVGFGRLQPRHAPAMSLT